MLILMIFLSIASTAIGCAIAVVSKAAFFHVLVRSVLATILMLIVGVVVFDPDLDTGKMNLHYLVTFSAYYVFPYVVFMLVPSVIGAAVVRRIKPVYKRSES